jgi:hypothetical protein
LIALALTDTWAATPVTLPACPSGTHAVGKAPPDGHEWRCENAAGKVDGPWLLWYEDGRPMSERTMKNGVEHGRQRGWWPNGQLMLEGISVDGSRYKGFKYWGFDGTPTDLGIQPDVIQQRAVPFEQMPRPQNNNN